MTDAERSKCMEVLKAIEAGIQEVEKRVNMRILAHSYMIIDETKAKVCFIGYNEIYYEIPYHIFMAIPPKRIIIEVVRALTIEFNDYRQEGCYKYQP